MAGCVAAAACVMVFLAPAFFGLPEVRTGSRVVQLNLNATSAWVVFLVALLLSLANLLWLVRGSRGPAELPRHVVSDAPGGTVKVSCDAVETGLRTAGEALPEITRVRVQVFPNPSAKKARVQAWFQCPEGVSNLEASRRLRQSLQDRFATMVRLPEGGRAEFEIEFLGFSGRLRKSDEVRTETATAEEEPPPFRGPQYPIPEEEDDA